MSAKKQLNYMTVEQYLKSEDGSPVRREYVDGQVFAMSGSTRRHNIIVGNLYAALRAHLKGSTCRAYIEAVKVRVDSANCFYYPDVMVACDPFDAKSVFSASPVLIIEVLSPSTAATDRREKRVNYMKIPTLAELLFVHQRQRRVELQRRNEGDNWDVFILGAKDEIVLESLANGVMTLTMDAIYEEAEFNESDGGYEVREELAGYELDEYGVLDY